ncbi:hypothetical protein KK083_15265 [Fulvivirgaceae bacterium PWU4]|uniref:Uncharacterized protein n=1 Tax=Chryseosolibacter histidini TaxID=2782349 RepID=A0AAP2DKX6_9BACT|nr:hypothetical protein [Chryseosolibacter histidini]MBT1698251.1 hypothetical protein [Chryseosolibacter histidini]
MEYLKTMATQGIENAAEIVSLCEKFTPEQLKLYANLLRSVSRLTANRSKGGKSKGDQAYQRFKVWAAQSGFDFENYKTTAQLNLATIITTKGFPISEKTAAKYRLKYLSEENK